MLRTLKLQAETGIAGNEGMRSDEKSDTAFQELPYEVATVQSC